MNCRHFLLRDGIPACVSWRRLPVLISVLPARTEPDVASLPASPLSEPLLPYMATIWWTDWARLTVARLKSSSACCAAKQQTNVMKTDVTRKKTSAFRRFALKGRQRTAGQRVTYPRGGAAGSGRSGLGLRRCLHSTRRCFVARTIVNQ